MKKIIPILTLLALFLLFKGVSAQESATLVRVSPASLQIAAGQVTALAVEVVAVEAVYGIDISLRFDPQALEVVDADPSLDGVQVSLGMFLEPGFVIINQADNQAGTVRLAMAQLNPSPPKSGTGNLVVINFRGKQAGATSDLELVSAKMARIDGTYINVTTQPGFVEVVEALPGATYTPVPTQGAGTPLPTPQASATPTPAGNPSATPTPGGGNPNPSPTLTPTPTVQGESPVDLNPTGPPAGTEMALQEPPELEMIVIAVTEVAAADEQAPQAPANSNTQQAEPANGPAASGGVSLGTVILVGLVGILLGGAGVYVFALRRKDEDEQSQSEGANHA